MLYEKNCSVQTARDRLGAFLFEGEDVFKTVGSLSGGEQSRLRLCMLLAGLGLVMRYGAVLYCIQ